MLGKFLGKSAVVAMLALAVPTLAVAQPQDEHHHPPGKPPPGAPHGATPHGPMAPGPHGPMAGPHPGPGPRGGQFTYHGHPFNRVHVAPFIYPTGWGYRRWSVGVALPPLFLARAYWYTDWGALGLAPPEPGLQWVRYGPDLLLVNLSTGQVVDVVYGAFYY
jgi:Ni/Co efflux regulator RcnB